MWQSYFGAGTLAEWDGRVLMVLHIRSGKVRWELPSGFIEPKESLEQAAIRETAEETSIAVEIERLLCTVVMEVPSEEYRGINAYYLAKVVSDNVPYFGCDGERILKAEYIDLSSIESRDIHPVDREILTRWKRRRSQRAFYFRIVL